MESLRSRCCQMPSGYLMLSSVNCKGEKKSNNPIFIHIPVKRIRVVKRGPMHANECRNYLFFYIQLNLNYNCKRNIQRGTQLLLPGSLYMA